MSADAKALPPIPSTPNNAGDDAKANMQTVTRKQGRNRQQTVTVECHTSKEIQTVFDEVSKMGLNDPIEELNRRMQRLLLQKEREWAFKMGEIEQSGSEELALLRIKLAATLKTAHLADELIKQHKHLQHSLQQQIKSPTSPMVNGHAPGMKECMKEGVELAVGNGMIQVDAFVEVRKERDQLREELRELENSYSDLFKRYEKMRENCVLLKNSEENLKKTAEDDAVKYEKLSTMFAELRDHATKELNRASMELLRQEKQHQENTLNLRCRLKRYETEVNTLNMTIGGKNGQIDELEKLCDELMQKNGVIYGGGEDTNEDDDRIGTEVDSYAESIA